MRSRLAKLVQDWTTLEGPSTLLRELKWHIGNALHVRIWKDSGRPIPPPPAWKQKTVALLAKKTHVKTLIETGTYQGDMVYSNKRVFHEIYSVELSKMFYERAVRRFAKYHHISIVHGDSGKELRSILEKAGSPRLFWLDAHFSGGETARGSKETPIHEELSEILPNSTQDDVILIDDARIFAGTADYPTIDELRNLVAAYHPDWCLYIEDDIVRIHKPPRL